MSLWEFARAGGSASLVEAGQALILSSAVLAADDGSGGLLAILPGVGLAAHHGAMAPHLLANIDRVPGIEPGQIRPIFEVPGMAGLVAGIIGAEPDWLKDVTVRGVTPPLLNLSPGDPILSPLSGTVGSDLHWTGGTGFATAGHVAGASGTTLYDASGAIGDVVWSNDPCGHGAGSIEPDFAVVRLSAGVGFASSMSGPVTAPPNASVTVLRSATPADIMGFCVYVFMPLQNATCGDMYFTTTQVTSPGDSGGVVAFGSDLVGHVIGASVGVCSYIQSAKYQITRARRMSKGSLAGLRM